MNRAEAAFQATGKPARRFRNFKYRTLKSWTRTRRVIGKAEFLDKGPNPRFVVTSLARKRLEARVLYEDFYCARGAFLTSSKTANRTLPISSSPSSCSTLALGRNAWRVSLRMSLPKGQFLLQCCRPAWCMKHTTTMLFRHVLFHRAKHPSLVLPAPLRQHLERVSPISTHRRCPKHSEGDVLQLSKISKRATPWVDQSPSYATTFEKLADALNLSSNSRTAHPPRLQFGTVALDPAPDCRVVRLQSALADQFFDIAERERVPQLPAHGAKNQLGFGLSPLENRRSDCLFHDLIRLPATVGQSCNTTDEIAIPKMLVS